MAENSAVRNVKQGLEDVLQQIQTACLKRSPELQDIKPRLVAAGKTQPVEAIIEAYEEGQRNFGENYVQELEEKATNPQLLEKCKDIKWHLIGHLQSNKVNKVLAIPNLYLIESVDSIKLATQLNNNWPKFGAPDSKLNIMIQVNTSGEEQKSGISPSEVKSLTEHVLKECPNLRLDGLMTIGKYGYDPSDGPNPYYLYLIKCRNDLCKELNLNIKELNLSMGMSGDFEQAIELGSTHVRVGVAIFGSRQRKI